MAKDELAQAVEAEESVTKEELLDRAREAGIEGALVDDQRRTARRVTRSRRLAVDADEAARVGRPLVHMAPGVVSEAVPSNASISRGIRLSRSSGGECSAAQLPAAVAASLRMESTRARPTARRQRVGRVLNRLLPQAHRRLSFSESNRSSSLASWCASDREAVEETPGSLAYRTSREEPDGCSDRSTASSSTANRIPRTAARCPAASRRIHARRVRGSARQRGGPRVGSRLGTRSRCRRAGRLRVVGRAFSRCLRRGPRSRVRSRPRAWRQRR
jgi:hypothetical protein